MRRKQPTWLVLKYLYILAESRSVEPSLDTRHLLDQQDQDFTKETGEYQRHGHRVYPPVEPISQAFVYHRPVWKQNASRCLVLSGA